ncbi:uncharacterized protein A1O9_12998, partial [Exophiala aquamarina CBS 119918]
LIPIGKRIYSTSLTKKTISFVLLNRVYRIVIVSNYIKPIYRVSSYAVILAALEGYIKGKGYYTKSLGNLMMSEDPTNSS